MEEARYRGILPSARRCTVRGRTPGGYSLAAGFVAEAVLTIFFLLVILGATDPRAPAGFGGLSR